MPASTASDTKETGPRHLEVDNAGRSEHLREAESSSRLVQPPATGWNGKMTDDEDHVLYGESWEPSVALGRAPGERMCLVIEDSADGSASDCRVYLSDARWRAIAEEILFELGDA